MDPDLVGPAGFQPAERAGSRPVRRGAGFCPRFCRRTCPGPCRIGRSRLGILEHLPMGDGVAAALADRHALAGISGGGRSAGRWCRAGARARPRRRRGSRARTARRCGRGRRTARPAPRWARSFLATTISPVVSLSSRCTMPGRRSPPMPERLSPQWAISALTSVPVQWPAAGCTTRPAGLSMTMMSSSS